VAFARALPARAFFARPQRTLRHAAQLLRVVLEIPAIPEFAVTDAVDADLDLLLDHRGHLPWQGFGLRHQARQAAGVGRSDIAFAALHDACLSCACRTDPRRAAALR